MPSRISVSVGSGFWPSSQVACMIMPGVQKPHCRPCWSQKACWSGWRVAPAAMPSMVLIVAPSAWTASIVHDLALSPSTMTVHAPQLLVSQPMCVPVSPKSSRRRWTSRRRGSTSASRASPLTVTGCAGWSRGLLRRRVRGGPRRRSAPGRSSPRPSLACSRPDRGGRSAGRLWAAAASAAARKIAAVGLPRRRASASASVAANGVSATAVRPMPAWSIRPSAPRRSWTATADGGEVAGPPLELLVGGSRCRRARRGMRISVSTSVGSIAVWKVSTKKSRAAIVRSPFTLRQTSVAPRGDQHGRPVRRRIGVGAGAADRAPVADLRIADAAGGLVDAPDSARRSGVSWMRRWVTRAPIRSSPSCLDDAVEAGDVADVDQQGRRGEAELEERQQAVAAGQDLGVAVALARGSGAPRRRPSAGRSRTGPGSSRTVLRPSR